jgi:hypothetical protein
MYAGLTASVFDRIEELSGLPRPFCWVKNAALMSYTKEELLYEGELWQQKGPEGKYVANRYVLTLFALIKHKVRHE